jgi:hypothetical protein
MNWLRASGLALILVVQAAAAGAQTATPGGTGTGQKPPLATQAPMHHPTGMPDMAGMMGHGHMGGMPGMMRHSGAAEGDTPAQPGQAAFGAIQEIVGMLESDPHTDWSKVDIDALRQHLIDMDEVTMRAAINKEPIDGGLRIEIKGDGRTLEAIQRVVPEHAREIDGLNGWTVHSTGMPDGVELSVTAANPAEAQKIRTLGFMGILVQGSHHQVHHLAMAKGESIHVHQPVRP